MIEFRMLGTVNLTAPDGREQSNLLAQTRRLALLAYLAAASPRGPRRRDHLLGMFWPELDQEHGRAALRQALHVLRAGLGAGALISRGEDVIVLDAAEVWCDVAAFDAALALGQEEPALDLYRGGFLDGFFISGAPLFEDWVASERSRLEVAAADALRRLIEKARAGGNPASALPWARRAVRLAPLDQDLLRKLMALLEAEGDAAGSLRAFDDLERRLAAEAFGEPEGRTRALASAIRERLHAAPRAAEPAQPAQPAPPPPPPSIGPPAASSRKPRYRAWAAAALFALPILFLAARSGRDAAPSERIRSLAVLPLGEIPGEAESDSAAAALAEALTTELSQVPGLRVISRQSATVFTGTAKPLGDVARELGVEAVVAGSLRQAGDEVVADLRLVRSQPAGAVWSGSVRAPRRNLATLAVRALRSALGEQPAALPLASPEAYDLYLRGRIRLRRENEAENSAAIALLERAVVLAPGFAAAHAELSNAYGLRVAQFAPQDGDALERAELHADAALRADPALAEAHYAAGHLLWGVGPGRFVPERAVPELKRALALNPNLAEAHQYLGQVLLHIGLLEEAVVELQKALALDPMSDNAFRRLGIALLYRGRYEEGLRAIRQVPPESNSSLWHYQVAGTLLHLGRTGEAVRLMEDYLRAHPEDRGGVVTSTRAVWFAKSGDSARAEADIREAAAKGKGFVHFHHTAYNIASAYALLARPEAAVEWLRRAAQGGWPCYPVFAADPNLDRIRADQGYLAFMRELKAQWERYRATL